MVGGYLYVVGGYLYLLFNLRLVISSSLPFNFHRQNSHQLNTNETSKRLTQQIYRVHVTQLLQILRVGGDVKQ